MILFTIFRISLGDTDDTSFLFFLWRGLSPLSPIGIAKKMDIYFSFHQQFAYFR